MLEVWAFLGDAPLWNSPYDEPMMMMMNMTKIQSSDGMFW
jgi:hypothetical protein